MGFFSRLREMFGGRPASTERYLPIYVTSNRCRDVLAGRIDTLNELSGVDADNAHAESAVEGEAGSPAGAVWFVRKGLTTAGRNRCFDTVEVRVWFDGNRRVVGHEVEGGRWLDAEEYARLLQERDEREAAARAAAQAAAEAAKTESPQSPAADQSSS